MLRREAVVVGVVVMSIVACGGRRSRVAAVDRPPPRAAISPASGSEDLTRLVNPFIGTKGAGNTFPGASLAFGMVEVSPDTGGTAGYSYDDRSIFGFSQTHLSGVGCPALGDVPIMPTTGAIVVDPNAYASKYVHEHEDASPGSYRVRLETYGVDVELTATTRTGWQRYTFPRGQAQGNVLFDAGRSLQKVFSSEVRIAHDRTVEGWVKSGHFCSGSEDQHTVYFSAEFDRPFASFGTWKGTELAPNSRTSTSAGRGGAWVSFDTKDTPTVIVKVGLSYTGLDGARQNLASETDDVRFDFDATRHRAVEAWNARLHAVEVKPEVRGEGAPSERRIAFYTALYHSLLHPNVVGDIDGRYRGTDGRVHAASGFTPYANFSLWDTYRSQNQLVALLFPEVARDVYLSILAGANESGSLVRWGLLDSETNVMTGDPVTPFVVEGWSKGLLAGHEAEAYEMLHKNVSEEPPASSRANGRTGIGAYARRGYVPSGLVPGVDCTQKFGDNDCAHPASATLEYAAADAALALMAEGLGHTSDAQALASRGQSYRNLWDSDTGTFRPRTREGAFVTPYEPAYAGGAFHEGGAFQYAWLVPQDFAGLVELMGGPRATEQRLDEFFAYDALARDPSTTSTVWATSPFEYYGKRTYSPSNELDLIAPYVYLWARAPHKTATVVKAARALFTIAPDGIRGNDDLGTMSAWYVWSSLGIYPTMSGANFFALTSPEFERATIHIGRYQDLQGGTFTIEAPGVGDREPYIVGAQLGAELGAELDWRPWTRTPWNRSWLSWDDMRHGGSLRLRVASVPGAWGTSAGDVPPSMKHPAPQPRNDLAAQVSDVLLPTANAAQTAKLTVTVLAQAAGSVQAAVELRVPPGWRVEPARVELDLASAALPVKRESVVVLTAPPLPLVASAEYAVTARVSANGLAPVDATARVMLRTPRCAARANGQCGVDLSEYANKDGTSRVGEGSSRANFDGSRRCLDAALLPPPGHVEWGGVTYAIPPAEGDVANVVEARGQPILLPKGRYESIRVVGAAHHQAVDRSGDGGVCRRHDKRGAASLHRVDARDAVRQPGRSRDAPLDT
jgi:predicted alpha-1,2-mannosidase